VTTQRSDASSLMSLFARLVFFHLRGEIFLGLHPFEVCITEVHCLFGNDHFLGPSPSLRDSKRKDCFLKHLSLHSGSLNQPSRFFSVAFGMIASSSRDSFGFIRYRLVIPVVDSDPSNYFFGASCAVLSFELWTPIPRIISLGLAAMSYHLSCGCHSLESFLFGQQHRWVTSFEITTYPCVARLAVHLVRYSRVFVITH
jgi:hypothetical protein